MVDFLKIATRSEKKDFLEIYPKFIVGKSSDLMIRAGDFYAVWVESKQLWSCDEQDLINIVDSELDNYYESHKSSFDGRVRIMHMWDSESGSIDLWHKYCQKQMRDNFHPLDENLVFSNQETTKKDYSTKRLTYPLEKSSTKSYDELMSVLYSDEERRKIEWAIGCIVTGDSKTVQKFMVLYGATGTGKSTVIDIFLQLFNGYCGVFDSSALASSSNQFALEAFKSNPIVAIQQDGDLSKIEDNTRINSLTSHEDMSVNEKHKSIYSTKFNSFLIMGTNKPVKITDAKSGLIRRLIDVHPTGKKIPLDRYLYLVSNIKNELSGIAWHGREVYLEDPNYYKDYVPKDMMSETNDFYNFVLDSYNVFNEDGEVSLKAAWEMYKTYCDQAKVAYPYSMRLFKTELKNYFETYDERVRQGENWVRSYYSGFKSDIFNLKSGNEKKDDEVKSEEDKKQNLIDFEIRPSKLDEMCKDFKAQYANEDGLPQHKWSNVSTTLKDIDTSKLHYLLVPENHIVIDFDIKGEDGKKNYEKNLEEASKWPKTYAELSKSGAGIHLHYIYDGDVKNLENIYSENIEVKVFTGNSSVRRKLTKCNNESVNHLSDILPKKKEKKILINSEAVKNEKAIRTIIIKNLKKEYHPATKPSVDFIFATLEEAYNSGIKYDVSDMYDSVFSFAASSTNNSAYCISQVSKMHFKSDEPSDSSPNEDQPIVIFDSEVFPNLYLVNYKKLGDGNKITRLINPTREQIEVLLKYRLVGFNNRHYDNHILYARYIGKNNMELFEQSQEIIVSRSKINGGMYQEAYNISYTDIYDYSSDKKSLKQWEIDLGIHHKELGLPWDKPVPIELWQKVSEYCDNDVTSTEAVWNATKEDFAARQILCTAANKLCPSKKSTVNDTTNILTGRIIFRGDRHPQNQFVYTNLATGERTDGTKDPHPFPGYEYKNGVSTYLGEEIGEGGYVWAKPGMYKNVTTFDIASMHPHSVLALNLFGSTYTRNFNDVVDARISVKHAMWEEAKKALNGSLESFIKKDMSEEDTADLAKALKIAINEVYGESSAHFDNLFRDPRNIDNIVAKRGALFMCQLKNEVLAMGANVIHIKTDSIKISEPTESIKKYIIDRGKEYGYDFEVESIYDKICLVNNAVYIAKCSNDPENGKKAGKWTATGTQFSVPYVFKHCFSHEDITINDMCEAKSVKSAMYLNMNEGLPEGKDALRFVGKVGLFCPIKPGCGGGLLLRESKKGNGSIGYDSVVGTKNYRWLETEDVIDKHLEKDVDETYYYELVNSAIDTINKFGDYNEFVGLTTEEDNDLPF